VTQAASAITGTTAMTASCQANNAEFGFMGYFPSG
jgi:hypothetical protein